MTNSSGSGQDPNRDNYQLNHADNGGTIYSSQGGRQKVTNVTNNMTNGARSWAGWAAASSVVVDVIYFFYGMNAYTGQPGNSGDLWRAGIFFVLVATTGGFIRKWLRRRL